MWRNLTPLPSENIRCGSFTPQDQSLIRLPDADFSAGA